MMLKDFQGKVSPSIPPQNNPASILPLGNKHELPRRLAGDIRFPSFYPFP